MSRDAKVKRELTKENIIRGYDLIKHFMIIYRNHHLTKTEEKLFTSVTNFLEKKNRYYSSIAVEDFSKISYYKNIEGVTYDDVFLPEYRRKNCIMVKPGKFFKTLFPDAPDKEIQNFVSRWYSEIKDIGIISDDEMIETEDIYWAYYHCHYADGEKGSLGASCMKYGNCQEYLRFYENYDVKVIVLKNKNNKIKGRALLWENVHFPYLHESFPFMDRIYVHNDNDIELFKQYARKNGYVHKEYQSYDNKRKFVYKNEVFRDDIEISPRSKVNFGGYFPFVDTLSWLDSDGILDNHSEGGFNLECTDGNPDEMNIVFCASCDENINLDTEIFHQHQGDYICDHCFSHEYYYCEDCNEVTHENDASFLNDRTVCDACSEDYFHCEDCDDDFLRSNYTMHEYYERGRTSIICENCFSDNYFICDHCGCTERLDYECEVEDLQLCPDCATTEEKRIQETMEEAEELKAEEAEEAEMATD